MDYANDYDIEDGTEKKEEVKVDLYPEIQDTLDTVSVFEVSSGVFFYGGMTTEEILEWMQPHSLDVCITCYGNKSHLEKLYQVLNFKSTILIYDKYKTFDDKAQHFLEKKAYELSGEGNIGEHTVYEFVKLNSPSYISCFHKAFTHDVVSLLFVGQLGFDDLAYNDATELLDIQFYSLKKGRSVVIPIPLNEAQYVMHYLEEKDTVTDTNFKGTQYELEF